MKNNKKKTALITGITGQDGAYLSEFLLSKNYLVHGIKRRSSLFNTKRIDHLYQDLHDPNPKFFLHHGDMTDATNLIRIIQEVQPDEIYNLAAQSHVQVSFETPEYTANADGLGTLRILEAIRILKLEKKTKFYQASTSELFGKAQEVPQTEKTPFYPRSPYACAKLYGYWITVNYREAYHMYACNGILFNHESSIRGETFVTRKITRAAARILLGLQETLFIGNLSAKRDWGHAKDFIEGMWLILQQDQPDDYILATGETHSVKTFIEMTFQELGVTLKWVGKKAFEKGQIASINKKKLEELIKNKKLIDKIIKTLTVGKTVIRIDPKYFRPTEVDLLQGDYTKAKKKLGWKPKHTLQQIVREMILKDVMDVQKRILLDEHGFQVQSYCEF